MPPYARSVALLRYAHRIFTWSLQRAWIHRYRIGGLLAKNQLLEVDASVLRFDYSFARPISSRGACRPPRADGTVGDV